MPDGSAVTYNYQGPYVNSISRNGLTHTYVERNLSGRPTKTLLANGETIAIEWDPLMRWKGYLAPHFKASYIYDEVGDLTHYHYADSLGEENALFEYDDLRQLVKEGGHTYTYDSLANRVAKDQQEYDHNDLFQITSDGARKFQYDKNGNLVSDGIATYEYDLLDRLIATTVKGIRTRYTYDVLNRRIAKNNDLYVWDGEHEIGTMRNGKIEELRILGEGKGAEIGAAVFIEVGTQQYIPIHDHTGSLVVLLTLEGKPYATYRYTAFGESIHSPFSFPWGFASKRYDPESGLIYFGKRYYAPSLGRWITPDPQGFQDGPNLYAYVHNNPLHYFDPYGLLAKSFAETRNFADFCGWLWYRAFSTIEWIGHNLIPVPGAREFIESGARFLRGGNFFEPRVYAYVSRSDGCTVPHVALTYHNGIMTPREDGTKQRDFISKKHGDVQVVHFYNPDLGFITSLIVSAIAKCGIKTPYEIMCERWYREEMGKDPLLSIIAYVHSQSGTRFNNVGGRLGKELCNRISVNSFGAATMIPRGDYKSADNYVSPIDFVPWTGPYNYLKGALGMDINLIFLKPSSMNPLTEHFLLGDTYGKQIERLGKDFQEKYLK